MRKELAEDVAIEWRQGFDVADTVFRYVEVDDGRDLVEAEAHERLWRQTPQPVRGRAGGVPEALLRDEVQHNRASTRGDGHVVVDSEHRTDPVRGEVDDGRREGRLTRQDKCGRERSGGGPVERILILGIVGDNPHVARIQGRIAVRRVGARCLRSTRFSTIDAS